ncbi:cuticle protein 38-like [Maniola jurtina]|uniref:cuticle protein 38-like n=1 Tax=Maniola jurtina TaxID=191418 RepID=UPI001E68906D|nr:cuticle protein 38-like [Maniola jurtina]
MFKLVVLFSVLALAAAKPGWVSPVAYSTFGTVPAVSSVSQYSSGVYHGTPVVPSYTTYSAYSPVVTGYGYPGVTTFTQAHNSPAVVLDAAHGVPLDTPAVVAARAAHYQAKALANAGVHTIAKRSVVSPVAYSSVVSPVSPFSHVASVAPVTPFVRSAYSPVAYSTPYLSAYSAPGYAYNTPGYAYNAPGYAYSAVVPKALSVHPW